MELEVIFCGVVVYIESVHVVLLIVCNLALGWSLMRREKDWPSVVGLDRNLLGVMTLLAVFSVCFGFLLTRTPYGYLDVRIKRAGLSSLLRWAMIFLHCWSAGGWLTH